LVPVLSAVSCSLRGLVGMLPRFLEIALAAAYDFPYFDVYFVGRPLNMLTALWCGVLRCMSGEFIAGGIQDCARPVKRLKLYEFEACPFCRKVREALCVLDLDVDVYPCPKPAGDASRFRSQVANPEGQTRFPVLVDDNGPGVIRGSEEIIAHLWAKYGDKATAPWNYKIGRYLDGFMPLFMLPNLLRLRPCYGQVKVPSKSPAKPLVLWGHEPSPFVKIVREALCSLELQYTSVAVPIGSDAKRQEFKDKYGDKMYQKQLRQAAGRIQIPMLVDPNTSEEPIFESAAIVKYLYETYGDSASASSKKCD